MTLAIEIIYVIIWVFLILINLMMLLVRQNLKAKANLTKLSGFEVAREVSNELTDQNIHIIKKKGLFLDHYNYERQTIKLSPEVFDEANLYSAFIALSVAFQISTPKASIAHKFNSFMVMTSYIVLIIGAFINQASIMHFGMILFILAFLFEMIILNLYGKNSPEMSKLTKKLIKASAENPPQAFIPSIIPIVRLPYGFLNFFR